MNNTVRVVLSLIVGLGVSLSGSQARPQPAEYSLDLLTYQVRQEVEPESPVGYVPAGHVSATTGKKPPSPLKATLESLDRLSYSIGDPFVYEIVIENVSGQDVVLPWSPDRSFVQRESPPTTALKASLMIEVTDRVQKKTVSWLEPRQLLGSEQLNGTLQRLAPGDRARIRVPGVMSPSNAGRIEIAKHQGLVRISAALILYKPQLLVRSVNGIDVIVTGRPARQ
jgi:hypothetical protein